MRPVPVDPPEPETVPVPAGLGRILLRLPNWMGDVVMAASAVASIARAVPASRLVAQAREALLPLAARLPGVAEAVPAGRDRGPRDLGASRARLRAHGFDAAVVFPRGLRYALAPWLAGIPVRVGFGGRGRLLTHPVRGWRPWRRAHRSAFYGLLARPFGGETASAPRLEVDPRDLAGADRVLLALGRDERRPLVVLEPGSAFGPAKCWEPRRFGELARELLTRGLDVATVGDRRSRSVEERVAAVAGRKLLRAAGRTPRLELLMGLLARADLVVSNDTGPMHLAAALGRPVLALFGATDPVVSAPLGEGPRVLLWEPEPCSPCLLRRCPVPGHPCLARLGVDRVLDRALALLEPRPPAAQGEGRRAGCSAR